MIDTVTLILKYEMFKVTKPEMFSPNANTILNLEYVKGVQANRWAVNNPTKLMKSKGYYPYLTLYRRYEKNEVRITLKIQFSAPKLIYRNNYYELSDDDFCDVLIILSERLSEMGVGINETNLAAATVSSVHYSKNIQLTDFTTPYTFIKELAKADVHKSLDINKTDYKNGGLSWKIHANSYEIIFYDKIKDYERSQISTKRSEEKDTNYQLDLFKDNSRLEVLRMEVRLNKKRLIQKLLRENGLNTTCTFSNLFSTNKSKTILIYYLNKLNKNTPALVWNRDEDIHFYNELIRKNKISLQKSFAIFGIKTMLSSNGVREFRNVIDEVFGKDAWASIKKDLNQADLNPNQPNVYSNLISLVNSSDKLGKVDYNNGALK